LPFCVHGVSERPNVDNKTEENAQKVKKKDGKRMQNTEGAGKKAKGKSKKGRNFEF
jgi:hypothetical protein